MAMVMNENPGCAALGSPMAGLRAHSPGGFAIAFEVIGGGETAELGHRSQL
jgi:hypothetical protein